MATTTFASDCIALLIVDLYKRLLERTTCRTCMLRFTATVSEFRSRTFESRKLRGHQQRTGDSDEPKHRHQSVNTTAGLEGLRDT
jgi:hypothetical protein